MAVGAGKYMAIAQFRRKSDRLSSRRNMTVPPSEFDFMGRKSPKWRLFAYLSIPFSKCLMHIFRYVSGFASHFSTCRSLKATVKIQFAEIKLKYRYLTEFLNKFRNASQKGFSVPVV